MADLSETSLSEAERRLVVEFVRRLEAELPELFVSAWLFGSRARGERPQHEGSDVDMLVLVRDDAWEQKRRVHHQLDEAAEKLDLARAAVRFSVHIHDLEWLSGRRAVKSFFIQEVDRDRIALAGEE